MQSGDFICDLSSATSKIVLFFTYRIFEHSVEASMWKTKTLSLIGAQFPAETRSPIYYSGLAIFNVYFVILTFFEQKIGLNSTGQFRNILLTMPSKIWKINGLSVGTLSWTWKFNSKTFSTYQTSLLNEDRAAENFSREWRLVFKSCYGDSQ